MFFCAAMSQLTNTFLTKNELVNSLIFGLLPDARNRALAPAKAKPPAAVAVGVNRFAQRRTRNEEMMMNFATRSHSLRKPRATRLPALLLGSVLLALSWSAAAEPVAPRLPESAPVLAQLVAVKQARLLESAPAPATEVAWRDSHTVVPHGQRKLLSSITRYNTEDSS